MRRLRDLMAVTCHLLILCAENKFLLGITLACEASIRLRDDMQWRGDRSWQRLSYREACALEQIARHLRLFYHNLGAWLCHSFNSSEFGNWPVGCRGGIAFDGRPGIAE